MKKGTSRHRSLICLLAGIAVSFALAGSCSGRDSSLRFSDSLARIDGYIAAGNSGKALKNLKKLSGSAQSSSQWLSIAKRERSLGADAAAVTTLKHALGKIPSSAELAAVLTDTLMRQKDYAAACAYSSVLAGSPYETCAAYAEIARACKTDPFSIDPRLWLSAASSTGLPIFTRIAAIDYAMHGNFAAACAVVGGAAEAPVAASAAGAHVAAGAEPLLQRQSSAPVAASAFGAPLPGQALFRATLWYDAGFPDQTLAFLSPDDPSIVSPEELSLMADAAWKLNWADSASALWERAVTVQPLMSPLPYYNLAVVEQNPVAVKKQLEALLASFPTYYPAVVRYVRSVPENHTRELLDPLERELEKAGFRSLEMERKIAERPVTREEAANILATAINKSGASPDIRLIIENLRMDWFETTDTVKSASAMWFLLEKYPADPVLHSWALWYFISLGDTPTAIALNKGATDRDGAFCSALDRAFAGDLDRAEELFSVVANNDGNAWCALANIALIRERKKDFAAAEEKFSLAAGMAPNLRTKSRLQYEAARVLASQHDIPRAKNLLAYAVELDPSNYRANMLLRKLESQK